MPTEETTKQLSAVHSRPVDECEVKRRLCEFKLIITFLYFSENKDYILLLFFHTVGKDEEFGNAVQGAAV